MPEQIHNALAHYMSYLDSERQRARDSEDQEINGKITLLHDLYNSPDINPAHTAGLLEDITNLMAAKGGRGPKKSGVKGFMGEHDIPHSQILDSIIRGTTAVQGPTTTTGPTPGFENRQVPESPDSMMSEMPQGFSLGVSQHDMDLGLPMDDPSRGGFAGYGPGFTMPAASKPQFDGNSVLSEHIPIPPAPLGTPPTGSRMLDAARQMQTTTQLPQAQQPLRLSPEEMAQREGNAAGVKAGAVDAAKRKSERDAALEAGMSPQEYAAGLKAQMMKRGGSAAANKVITGTATVDGQDGQPIFMDPATHNIYQAGSNEPLDPSQLDNIHLLDKPGKAGATTTAYSQKWFQTPSGEWKVTYAPKDPAILTGGKPGDPPIPGLSTFPSGQVGHLPPPPQGTVQVLASPETGAPAPYRVTGTKASPITFDSGLAALKAPPPEKMSAQGKTALTGLNVVGGMIPDIMKDIQGLGIADSNNPLGQSWNLALAKRGISPGEVEENLLQSLGVADAYGLRGLMGGRPNQKLIEIVRVHLPQPGDSGRLAVAKLRTLSGLLPKLRQAIIDAELTPSAQRNPYTGQTSTSATSPASGIPAPPKSVTKSQLQQYATEHKIDLATATKVFTDKGYQVK